VQVLEDDARRVVPQQQPLQLHIDSNAAGA
jgi:hypothetical protein